MNNIQNNNNIVRENESKSKKQVKTLLALALEALYELDVQVESIRDEIPLTLLREYEKYVGIRNQLKLEQLQREKAIQLCNTIGNQLSLLGDELSELATSRRYCSKTLIKVAGTLLNASYIFMKAVDNQLLC
ncbi:hypothetical protein IOLA_167 [uncultured bacterium]|nr:hypothetical protein IOLA_167 [uncultured bacterium]